VLLIESLDLKLVGIDFISTLEYGNEKLGESSTNKWIMDVATS